MKLITKITFIVAVLFSMATVAEPYPTPKFNQSGYPRWGYVNTEGLFVIDSEFDDAKPFGANGFAKVRLGQKSGYINTTGNFVIQPLQYDDIGDLKENTLTRFRDAPIPNGRYGFLNFKGEVVIPAKFWWASLIFPEDDLCLVKQGGKAGYINKNSEYVIPLQFDDASDFTQNGLAAVKLEKKWGYIDKKSSLVIPAKYDAASNFSDSGLAIVKFGDKFGLINAKGDWVVQPKFDWVQQFDANSGLALVSKGNKIGMINQKGDYFVEPKFGRILGFVNGFALVTQDSKWGYIDSQGKVVIKPQFDSAKDFDANGHAKVLPNFPKDHIEFSKFGLINTKGEWVIQPGQYEHIGNFGSDGLAPAQRGKEYGYVNSKGEFSSRRAQ